MSLHQSHIVYLVAITSSLFFGVHAEEKSPASPAHEHPKKMKMDAPMSIGMMKKGMTKGDVKSAAGKKAQALQPMMEQEQKSMPPDNTKR